MPIYGSVTAGVLMRDLAQSLGDLIFDGTATAGAASALTDAAIPDNVADASRIIGAFKDNVRLDGSLSAMVAAVTTNDPQAAAKAYMDMVQSVAVK